MQPRRVARELALLSVSQLPATAAKLEAKQIEEFVIAAIRSLESEVHDTLGQASDQVDRSDRQLQDTEATVPLPLTPQDEPQSQREAAGNEPELVRVRQARQQLQRQIVALKTANPERATVSVLLSEVTGLTERAISAIDNATRYLTTLEQRLQSTRAEMREAIVTTQSAINHLGAAVSLPEFVYHADTPAVRDYAVRVTIAVQTHKAAIDEQLGAALVNWKLNRLGRIERDILRVAVAEIHVLNSVPQRVAINEAIELAKKYGDEESASFINGVLRRAISLSKERARAEIPSSTP